jgi:hypothetical protein
MVALILLLPTPPAARATVYVWRSPDGAIQMTNDPEQIPPEAKESAKSYTAKSPTAGSGPVKDAAGRTLVPAPASAGGTKRSTPAAATTVATDPDVDARERAAYERGFARGQETAGRRRTALTDAAPPFDTPPPADDTGAPERGASTRGTLRREPPPFVVRVVPRPRHPFSSYATDPNCPPGERCQTFR